MIDLGAGAWVHHEPGHFPGLLQEVLDGGLWAQETITMFGNRVPQPRLTAWFGGGGWTAGSRYTEPMLVPPFTPLLADAAVHLSAAFGARFDSVLANWYRDGRDSVGWHADAEGYLEPGAPIVSVSLGAPRAFQLRDRHRQDDGGRNVRSWRLVDGDIFAMGGTCQREFHHQVPKALAVKDLRVSLTFRACQTSQNMR